MKRTIKYVLAFLAAAAVTAAIDGAHGQEPSGVGALVIRASTHRGPVRGFAEIMRLDEETGKHATVTKKALFAGAVRIEGLAPGSYRAVITSSEEIEPQVKQTNGIDIKAGETAQKEVRFEQATVELVAADHNEEPLDGHFTVERCSPGKNIFVPLPHKVLAVSGRAKFYAAPGKYVVTFVPDGIVGSRGVPSEARTLADGEVCTVRHSVAFGSLVVQAKNFSGPVPSRLTIYASGASGRKLEPLFTRAFDGGPMEIRAMPGKYAVEVASEPGTILPPAAKIFEPVGIKESKKEHVSAYFECARLSVRCAALGPIDARLELQRWDEEAKEYAETYSTSLKKGATEIFLQAGKYRAVAVDQKVEPQERHALEDIVAADGGNVLRSVILKGGEICIVARLAEDAPVGTVALYRMKDEIDRRVLTRPLKEGRIVLPVAEGTYRVVTTVGEEGNSKEYAGRWLQVTDRARLMEVLDLGRASSRSLPPQINLWGPYEVGDGDGIFEVGERAKFTTGISGKSGVKTQIYLIVPEKDGTREVAIATYEKSTTDKDREFVLEHAGSYLIRIVSKNRGARGGEVVVERELTVVEKD